MDKVNLNGIQVTRVKDTVFIPLPRELWREIDGGCACEYCSKNGRAHSPAYWDTLAVSANHRGSDFAWTVHFPKLHGGQHGRGL